ncbi:hypothetical protein [Streptomyces rishiriensis]|uniref:Uncharacterized protein n=1 Tax=Streptomyces rishiriensis TaxID=68264 RepID=A0ABU0NQE6_STRRH|nr:hypothetical protein [Streptomyces rishiriensis]MDQ0581326.1 hypothetical protein [Streptomyces rishiriensis]
MARPDRTGPAERFVADGCQGALGVPGIAARLPRFARRTGAARPL